MENVDSCRPIDFNIEWYVPKFKWQMYITAIQKVKGLIEFMGLRSMCSD
jgi:hypothetical protein